MRMFLSDPSPRLTEAIVSELVESFGELLKLARGL